MIAYSMASIPKRFHLLSAASTMDVVHALEILGITPEDVYRRLKEDGLREEVLRIERLFHE